MVTFLLRSSPSGPPTRPVLSRYTWKLDESIALLVVEQREERIGAGHTEELSLLLLAARRRPLRLAEHEVEGGLLAIQPRYRGDDVLVAIEDQQVVDRLE